MLPVKDRDNSRLAYVAVLHMAVHCEPGSTLSYKYYHNQ